MIFFMILFLFVAGLALLFYRLSCAIERANDIRLEATMKPCPKCGHRAITVYYCGENNPPFFTAECGAYMRRNEYGHIDGSYTPEGSFDNDPPMTDEQRKCSYCAGYCAHVPHFATRMEAVEWWNDVACGGSEAGK